MVTLVVGRIAAVTRGTHGVTLLDAADAALAIVDEVVAVTGLRPDLIPLRELRLDLDPIMEAPRALAPLIDPNVHSCGTVPPHGEAELRHAEPGFYVVGMKSYGRAPTFLMLTGYEQVRSIACALTGDVAGARRVELTLPATGVCSTQPNDSRALATVASDPGASCCGGPAPADVDACCTQDAAAKAAGQDGCGCGSEPRTADAATGAAGNGPPGQAAATGQARRAPGLVPVDALRAGPRTSACCRGE
jgi:hypothetical protein